MNVRVVAAMGVLVLLGAGLFFVLGDGESRPDVSTNGGSTAVSSADDQRPRPVERPDSRRMERLGQVIRDDDPPGALRLEGQVLDKEGRPVGGADVAVDTRPARTARTELDGTFAFGRLVGRSYRLTARHEGEVGGPIHHKLSATSEPVIIRLRGGVQLEVLVVGADGGRPVAGAVVELRAVDHRPAVTDTEGVARFEGVASGFAVLAAEAVGYAPAHQAVQIPEGAKGTIQSRVVLKRGGRLAGKVIDEQGEPVPEARVQAVDTSSLIVLSEAEHDGVATDKQGRFVFPALADGTYRLVASHDHYQTSSSGPVGVDAARPAPDVRITMKTGGVVSGRVESAGGAPVAWASVRVVREDTNSIDGMFGGARRREATADREGRFTIRGLPRDTLGLMAVGESASSKAVAVDLSDRARVDGVVLRLEVDGRIAGMVVDRDDRPVPEVQVTASADIWKSGLSTSTLLHGSQSDMTDGAGRFELRGLPEGVYRLRASRSGGSHRRFLQAGVEARTGDEDVRLVLGRDGGIEGRLVFDDGGAPGEFSVTLRYPPGVLVSSPDGDFELSEVAAGTYSVTFRGPDFADTTVSGVEVRPDDVTDMGEVTVRRGRTVSGRVLDGGDQPVAGATVVLAHHLVGNGSSLTLDLGKGAEESMGLRRGVTGSDGSFRIPGVGTERHVLVAEHPDLGRSTTREVPEGAASPAYDLVLQGLGSVHGTVTSNGEPVSGAVVQANPRGEAGQTVIVHAGEDGSYQIGKLQAGAHRITAAQIGGVGLGARSAGRMVELRPGEQLRVDIDIPAGHVELTVQVEGIDGARIDTAQVLLLRGRVEVTTAAELNKAAMSAGGWISQGFWLPVKPAVFEEVVPGEYSVCVIPLAGDLHDPAFIQKLRKHTPHLKVHCQPLVIAASPDKQAHTAIVPPMEPFPTEPDPAAGTAP